MKSISKYLTFSAVFMIMALCVSCQKRNVEREIQRFKDATHDPQIVGTWYDNESKIELTPDGLYSDGSVIEQYFYTEKDFLYILLPGHLLHKNQINRYLYRVNNDTLHLMNGIWTRTPSNPSNDEN